MFDSEKNSESFNDFFRQLSTQHSLIRSPKWNKPKFMKQLNFYMNLNSPPEKKIQFSQQVKQYIIPKRRSKFTKDFQFQNFPKQIIDSEPKLIKNQQDERNLNGQVNVQFLNGNKFQGFYKSGLRIYGTMLYKQAKCEYQGGFIAERFVGNGKLTYYDGRTIEGQWQDMFIFGKATITYPNNDIYYGQVDEKLYKHGEGVLFLFNGNKYVGDFQNGSISGVGSYYNSKGELTVKGIWRKGKLIRQIQISGEFEQHWQTLEPMLQIPKSILAIINEDGIMKKSLSQSRKKIRTMRASN